MTKKRAERTTRKHSRDATGLLSALRSQFNRLRKRQFSTLYKSGFLPKDSFFSVCELLTAIPHLIQVHHRKRIVALFTHCNISDLDNSHLNYPKLYRFVKEHDCTLFFPKSHLSYKKLLSEICQHLNFIAHNTLVWNSMDKDLLNRYSDLLRRQLNEIKRLNVDDLATFIGSKLDVSISLVEKRSVRPALKSGTPITGWSTRGLRAKEPALKATSEIFVVRRLVADRFAENGPRLSPAEGKLADEALRGGKLIEVSPASNSRARTRPQRILFPLCRSTEPKSPRAQLFLVSNRRGTLSQSDIFLIQELISYYFDHLLRNYQHDLLTSTVARIRLMQQELSVGLLDRSHDPLAMIDEILTSLVWTTYAYRCSYWQYSSQYHAIHLVAGKSYRLGQFKCDLDIPRKTIGVNQFDRSSMANCFYFAHTNEPLYIANVRHPDRSLGGRQMKEIIAPSTETQSELLVPVFEGATPIGVLYCESRILDGLKNDTWFLKSIASLISELLTSVAKRRDAALFVERLSHFDSFHDLSTQLEIALKGHGDVLKRVQRVLDLDRDELSALADQRTISLDFAKVVDSVRNLFAFHLKEIREEIFSRVHVRPGTPMFKVSEHEYRAFFFVIKNLVTNSFRHGKNGFSTRLTIAFERAANLGRSAQRSHNGIIRLEYLIDPALSTEIVPLLGHRPIPTKGRPPRRGLYLVGVVCRQFGGTFEAVPSVDGKRTCIVLRIPMAGEREYRND